jgi:pimeloyl-ACP methyl ester carboxylesterase
MYASRLFGADGYHVNENHTVFTPTNLSARAPLVVVCHGTASQASWYCDDSARYLPLEGLAATGMVVVAADLGEPVTHVDGWGNDTSVARVSEVITWAAATFGCRTDRVSLLGDSAGGATALNWARAHPTQVAGVGLRAGVCDIESIYQGGAGNALLVSLINTAYDNTWPAQRATHDPALNTAQFVPIADRIKVYYSSGDDLVPPSGTLAFCDNVGCQAVPVGTMPHSDPIMTAVPAGELAGWFWELTTEA